MQQSVVIALYYVMHIDLCITANVCLFFIAFVIEYDF